MPHEQPKIIKSLFFGTESRQKIRRMNVPENLRYVESHEWIESGEAEAKIGISDHAQAELSDVVYVELPEVGKVVAAKDPVAVVESVKAANDIYSPVTGEVTAVNDAVANDPSLINSDPFGEGWLFKLKVADASEVDGLLDASGYTSSIG